MTSDRTESPEFAEPLVMVMGERRRGNLIGVRNLFALIALLCLCSASVSLAGDQGGIGWATWRTEAEERGFLLATILIQAGMTISGMLVAHSVLSRPPQHTVRSLASRLVGYVLTLAPVVLILAAGAVLEPGALPVPRLLLGMVLTYPLCSVLVHLLLSPLVLRQWAWAVAFAALALWMFAALAAGTAQASAPSTVVAASAGLSSMVDAQTLTAVLTLGCCFLAGAAIACVGNLVDDHGPVVRGLVPPVAAVGTLIFLPQMLTGASVGHLMLATTLAPLVDLDFPRFATGHDVGFGFLTLGWIVGAAGSLAATGSITASWTALFAMALGVPLSVVVSRLLVRPVERGLRRELAARTADRFRARRAHAAQTRQPEEHEQSTPLPDGRRRLVADRGRSYWEDRPAAAGARGPWRR